MSIVRETMTREGRRFRATWDDNWMILGVDDFLYVFEAALDLKSYATASGMMHQICCNLEVFLYLGDRREQIKFNFTKLEYVL